MKIVIQEYSNLWKTSFQAERKRLSDALFYLDAHIEHIGSTAVPGLMAKPVVDIMIGLCREEELEALVGSASSLGYEYVPDYEAMMPFRRFFRRNGENGISFHLHAVVGDTLFWRDHLLFRDLLREDRELRTAYETLKKELAEREWPSGNDYAAAKGKFIRDALTRGRKGLIDAAGREVYQVSTTPLAFGERLRSYYLKRNTMMIESAMDAIVSGADALLIYCRSGVWEQLEMPQEFPLMQPGQLRMMIVLEALFEQVRREEAPQLSSRLASVFTWPTRKLAIRFRETYFPDGVIHRCVIRSGSAFECDGALIPPGINLNQTSSLGMAEEVKRVRQRAIKYWRRGHEPEFPELLVQGNVEVAGTEIDICERTAGG